MKIISFNANGIRSAANKGFFDWLRQQDADVVCLQETKAQEDQLTDPMFRPDGHHCFYRDAVTKKGYSGVAIYAKREPDEVLKKIGWKVSDVDLFEVNEAFATVAMAPMRELGIEHAKLNVNGGACALGHPIGASGARLLVTLLHALKARGGRRGVASLCIGGGEATAVAVELASRAVPRA